MCGIAGAIRREGVPNNRLDRAGVLKMTRAIAHRGPDGDGIHEDSHRFLANVRLAIVDRAGGQQPIYNGNQSIGIVYNGEIYNYPALRKELEATGRVFKTRTDTEVVLAVFEEWGVDGFTKLEGMFAFAAWNETTTYLVRDPFGIKPLYLHSCADGWVFSSELRGLLAWADLDLQLSPEGIADYLTFRYVPWPNTLLAGVRRLAPGEVVAIDRNTERTLRQLPLPGPLDPSAYRDPRELAEELRRQLRKSVESQLMGEVPIGICLSGGVDSSAIAHCLHDLGANLRAFSIGFPEVNEFKYSRDLAKKYNLPYEEHVMNLEELIHSVPDFLSAVDEPIADPACLPLLKLAKEMRKSVTVVLSGEGGDELFGGYNQYGHIYHSTGPEVSNGSAYRSFLDRSWYFTEIGDLYPGPVKAIENRRFLFEGRDVLDRMSRFDMATWVPDNLMMKADKILMSQSLEGRFPFLTPDMWRLAAGLPPEMRISPDGVTKVTLKQAFRKQLPRSILDRAKMGFTTPVEELLRGLAPVIEDTLPLDSGIESIVDKKQVMVLWREFLAGRSEHALRIWTVLVLHLWCLQRARWSAR